MHSSSHLFIYFCVLMQVQTKSGSFKAFFCFHTLERHKRSEKEAEKGQERKRCYIPMLYTHSPFCHNPSFGTRALLCVTPISLCSLYLDGESTGPCVQQLPGEHNAVMWPVLFLYLGDGESLHVQLWVCSQCVHYQRPLTWNLSFLIKNPKLLRVRSKNSGCKIVRFLIVTIQNVLIVMSGNLFPFLALLLLQLSVCVSDCKLVCHKKCLSKIVTDCNTFCSTKVWLAVKPYRLNPPGF